MRKYFAFLVIVLGLCAQGFAHDHTHYYVQPGGVYVAPDGIFVMFDGKMIQVDMLCADANGVYVPGIEMESKEFLFCSGCGHWFPPSQIYNHGCKGPSWQ